MFPEMENMSDSDDEYLVSIRGPSSDDDDDFQDFAPERQEEDHKSPRSGIEEFQEENIRMEYSPSPTERAVFIERTSEISSHNAVKRYEEFEETIYRFSPSPSPAFYDKYREFGLDFDGDLPELPLRRPDLERVRLTGVVSDCPWDYFDNKDDFRPLSPLTIDSTFILVCRYVEPETSSESLTNGRGSRTPTPIYKQRGRDSPVGSSDLESPHKQTSSFSMKEATIVEESDSGRKSESPNAVVPEITGTRFTDKHVPCIKGAVAKGTESNGLRKIVANRTPIPVLTSKPTIKSNTKTPCSPLPSKASLSHLPGLPSRPNIVLSTKTETKKANQIDRPLEQFRPLNRPKDDRNKPVLKKGGFPVHAVKEERCKKSAELLKTSKHNFPEASTIENKGCRTLSQQKTQQKFVSKGLPPQRHAFEKGSEKGNDKSSLQEFDHTQKKNGLDSVVNINNGNHVNRGNTSKVEQMPLPKMTYQGQENRDRRPPWNAPATATPKLKPSAQNEQSRKTVQNWRSRSPKHVLKPECDSFEPLPAISKSGDIQAKRTVSEVKIKQYSSSVKSNKLTLPVIGSKCLGGLEINTAQEGTRVPDISREAMPACKLDDHEDGILSVISPSGALLPLQGPCKQVDLNRENGSKSHTGKRVSKIPILLDRNTKPSRPCTSPSRRSTPANLKENNGVRSPSRSPISPSHVSTRDGGGANPKGVNCEDIHTIFYEDLEFTYLKLSPDVCNGIVVPSLDLSSV